MPTRLAFHEELRVLEDRVLAMGDLVATALERAVRTVLEHDQPAAQEVIAGDDVINELHNQVTRDVTEVVATQQPIASDLREILASFSIATDLERIGDHAKGISSVALRTHSAVPKHAEVQIDQMGVMVRDILAGAMDTYVKKDADAARELAQRDDEVDRLYNQIYEELLEQMAQDPTAIKDVDRLMWVAKSLERCGDHVTNICEWVVFLRTGHLVELNR